MNWFLDLRKEDMYIWIKEELKEGNYRNGIIGKLFIFYSRKMDFNKAAELVSKIP